MTLALRPLPSRQAACGAAAPRGERHAGRAPRPLRADGVRHASRSTGRRPPSRLGSTCRWGSATGQRLIQRPYSIASPPGHSAELEFFIRRVSGGAFTSLLWAAPIGTRLRVGPPRGLFMLDREDRRDRLFISAGTGLAPFLSMLGAECRSPHAHPDAPPARCVPRVRAGLRGAARHVGTGRPAPRVPSDPVATRHGPVLRVARSHRSRGVAPRPRLRRSFRGSRLDAGLPVRQSRDGRRLPGDPDGTRVRARGPSRRAVPGARRCQGRVDQPNRSDRHVPPGPASR